MDVDLGRKSFCFPEPQILQAINTSRFCLYSDLGERSKQSPRGGKSMALIYFSLDSRSVVDITPYSEVTDAKKPGPGPTCIPSVLKVVRMRSPDTPRVAALDADSTRTCQK